MYISRKHDSGRYYLLLFAYLFVQTLYAQSSSYSTIHKDMVYNTTGLGDAFQLFDQDQNTVFQPRHANGFDVVPAEVVLRLKSGASNQLTHINFRAAAGAKGRILVSVGVPGNWMPLSANPLDYGNGITGLAWYPIMQNVQFIKVLFMQQPGDTQALNTGDLFLNLNGDYAFNDADACNGNQADCRKAANSFDTYMGVNNFLGKTQLTHQFAPFTGVREYLPWDHVQGHIASGTSIQSTDHAFQYAPAFPGYDIDRHYANLAGAGKELLVDLKESSPFQMFFDYDGGHGTTLNQLGLSYAQLGSSYLDLMERKPGRPEGGVNPNALGFLAPETYANHGEAMFQTALRYGTSGNTAKQRFKDGAGKANQGTAKWIENWNEQDKWWNQPNVQAPVDGGKEKRLQFFTPKEYMAMTFADYKPKAGDLALPMVMSGLAELDVEYLKGMYLSWWELTGSDPSLSGNWPFKAINYHHYSVKDWQYGIAPEKDYFIDGNNSYAHLSRITGFMNKYLNNSELWITEFGYSDHPQDVTSAKANYPNANYEEVQAQWILRSYLQYYRYGVDRAFAYQLVDDGPNQWHAVFNHTGFIDRTDAGGGAPTYRYKKSWYYTYTIKQHLAGLFFKNEQNATTVQGRPLRTYHFESADGQRKASALWVPDDTNPATGTATIATNGHKKVQVVRFTHEKIGGTTELFEDHDNDGQITLSGIGEQPVLLLWDSLQAQVAECGCATDLSVMTGNASSLSAISDTKTSMQAAEHPRCNYGPNGATIWEGAQAETLTLNIGGGSMTDIWNVDAIYINDPTWNQGILTLELLDTADKVLKTITYAMDGVAQYPYQIQGADYVWKTFDAIGTQASRLRVQRSFGLRVGEIILCARPALVATTSTPVTPPVTPPIVPPVVPPVVVPTTPPPPTNPPVACDCAPFPVAPLSVTYELGAGQSLPSSQTLFSSCLDQMPDKNPSRMFDEQNPQVLGMICGGQYDLIGNHPDYSDCTSAAQQGYPITEWFPGWSNQYPYQAVIDFGQTIEFKGLFLYDSNDEGQLSFEYRNSPTEAWKTLAINGSNKTYKTSAYRKWRSLFQSPELISASQMRVTMHSQGARFSELAFCGPKSIRKTDEAQLVDEAQNETEQEVEASLPDSYLSAQGRQIFAPGTSSLTSTDRIVIFPNPADRYFSVDGISSEITHFVLFDMTGRRIHKFETPGKGRILTVDVSQLPMGVYVLSAFSGGRQVQMERVIVK